MTVSVVPNELITKARAYVEDLMSRNDGSHDFHHILRVVGLTQHLYTHSRSQPQFQLFSSNSEPSTPPLDAGIITLAALLHDVGDRKYLSEGQDPLTQISSLLLSFGASPSLASTIQTICTSVSYTYENLHPEAIQEVLQLHPELAIVQDADRLDALGAVGIGRVFTFGAVKRGRSMCLCVEMIREKLYGREGRMKTEEGKRLAKERVKRLRAFEEWWREEEESEEVGKGALGSFEGQ